MAKKLVKCPECRKEHWAKVTKDKTTKEVYVDILDQYCQSCMNRIQIKDIELRLAKIELRREQKKTEETKDKK